jgi:hypothetical protein
MLTRTLPTLLVALAAACRVEYTCSDACAKLYERCNSAVVFHGVTFSGEQCRIACEEGRDGAATPWLDCIEDSVCHGEVADEEDRDLRRYDIEWCNPAFPILKVPG